METPNYNGKKWLDFTNTARSTLFQGQSIDSHEPTIQIAIEPSFDNSTLLQLVISDDVVLWYRTTWLKSIDAPKFSDLIENLKYIGQTIKPTVRYESGSIAKEKLKDIIESIQTLSVPANLDKPSGFVLDGTWYTLTIGVESMQTTYKWHYLPDNWTTLQKLVQMLQDLNEKFLKQPPET
jgi:hypothetical protein